MMNGNLLMMTVEIKINGSIIGHIYLHNEDGLPESTYYVEVYECLEAVDKFRINHKRNEGAFVLVQRAIKQYEQNKTKRIN